MQASSNSQSKPYSRSYGAIADSIQSNWGENYYNGDDRVKNAKKDKDALMSVYDVFKSRFSGSQRKNLDAMAKQLDNLEPITDNLDEVGSTMGTFAQALSTAVGDLS